MLNKATFELISKANSYQDNWYNYWFRPYYPNIDEYFSPYGIRYTGHCPVDISHIPSIRSTTSISKLLNGED